MPDQPRPMWKMLLEEHCLLTESKQQPGLPSFGEIVHRIEDEASKLPRVDRADAKLRAVYRIIHASAAGERHQPSNGKRALCLSGGGIRSATFNLGLIQGLALDEKLKSFDFLSTVSGGGFAGSWLSAWSHRSRNGIAGVEEALNNPHLPDDNPSANQQACIADLESEQDPGADAKIERREVSHLRDYSNYLTPRLGFLSSDTWALLAIFPRNLLLNWMVLIPMLLSLILFFWAVDLTGYALNQWAVPASIHYHAPGAPYTPAPMPFQMVRWAGMALFLLGIAAAIALVPRSDADEPSGNAGRLTRFKALTLSGMGAYFPLVAGILLLTLVTPGLMQLFDPAKYPQQLTQHWLNLLIGSVEINAGLAVVALAVRKMFRFNPTRTVTQLAMEFVALFFSINLCGLIPVALLTFLVSAWHQEPGRWHQVMWLAPAVRSGALFLWFTLIVGFHGDNPAPDYENGREWWARLTGILLRFSAIYVVLYGAIIILPIYIDWHWVHLRSRTGAGALTGTGLAAIGSAFYAIKWGKYTNNIGTFKEINPELYKSSLKLLPGLAALLFLALTLVGTSCLVLLVIEQNTQALPSYRTDNVVNWPTVLKVVGCSAGLVVVALVASWPINVNRFSLGGTYRSRLIRAYLGASRGSQRDPDPFTGFDARDNLPMHFLRRGFEFSAAEINMPEAARLLVHSTDRPFFHRARQSDLLSDRAVHDQLKSYSDTHGNTPEKPEIERLILQIMNELLIDKELYTHTYRGIDKQQINADIQAAHEQRDADGSVRMRNRLIIEEQLNKDHVTQVVRAWISKPFHVINATLNLVHGKKLAWQHRKSKSFVFTPLYSGYDLGYRSSTLYGNGITLGGAMSISGAAASPNMGYHSSPLLTMLMMLFNVRLGAWYGNPAYGGCRGRLARVRDWVSSFPFINVWPTWRLASPRFSFRSYIDEAFGRTGQDNPYIYLSDGGHFDNLGLYEMIRRRCHLIIVSDATADLDRKFTDLGNAIQKIRIDMGVPITIDKDYDHFLSPDPKAKFHYRVVTCTIDYSGDGDGALNGRLIYIKPAINAKEPFDVYTYGRESESFPHESTADQWFSEAQFECYRFLGEAIAQEIKWNGDGGPDGPASVHPDKGRIAEVVAGSLS